MDSLVHRDLSRQLLLALTLTLAGGIVGAAYGWTRIPEVLGFAWLVTGLVMMTLSFWLWSAREWARITVGSLAALMAIAHIVSVLRSGDQARELGPSIASITYAAYFWLPSTHEVFREAREARTRDQEVRRRQQLQQRVESRTPQRGA